VSVRVSPQSQGDIQLFEKFEQLHICYNNP